MVTNGELRVVQKYIPDCEVIFDVGAHEGEWTRLVLQCNPSARLYCFEPSHAAFEKLLRKNFPSNVICHNFGFSSKKSEVELFVFQENTGMNTLYPRRGLQDRGVGQQEKGKIIQLRTIDDYCSETCISRIDYLKIDVEGHELEVLKGSRKMLEEGKIGMIQFEYGGCDIDSRVLLKDFFDLVQGLPYLFYKILPKKLLPVPQYSQQFENFQYSNWLARNSKWHFSIAL